MKTDVNNIEVSIKGKLYNLDHDDIAQFYADGNTFAEIEGDFYIKIIDHDKKKVLHISDFAGTHSSRFMQRNSIMTFTLDGEPISLSETNPSKRFRFYCGKAPVIRKDYDHFFDAVERAVKIRHEKDCVLALSDGHDSGAICASIIKQNLSCSVVTALSSEDAGIVRRRISMIKKQNDVALFLPLVKNSKDLTRLINEIKSEMNVDKNHASNILSHYVLAKAIQNRVLLSGLGADEFYVSGYHQLLLEFLRDSQYAYEHFNVSARFPLLDYNVFSEYFNLHGSIKSGYKKPLSEYMKTINLPCNFGEKHSFVVGQENI